MPLLPSPQASFFLAAKAFRVTWSVRKCEGVSCPFASDTSPKRIDRERLGKRRTGTKQVPLQISFSLTVTAILRHLENFWSFIECVSNKKKNDRKLGSNLDLSNPNLSRALPLNFHTHQNSENLST